MKKTKDAIEFTLEEFATFLGKDAHICPACGKMHPTWDWAQFKNTCEKCKNRPSEEEVKGLARFQFTPERPAGAAAWIKTRQEQQTLAKAQTKTKVKKK